MILRIAAIVALTACSSDRPPPSNHPDPPPTPTVDAAMTANPVQMKIVALDLGRPPQKRMRFDVSLDNRAAAPRWFLFPYEAGEPPTSGNGIDGVEVDSLGSPAVLVGRFMGSGGVKAVLLPAGGKVTIHRLTIESFAEEPPHSLEVVVAHDLRVGGEDPAAWFKGDPTAPAAAEVSEDARTAFASRFTPDRSEVPLTFAEDQRITVSYDPRSAPLGR
jgi:hypothetical protein